MNLYRVYERAGVYRVGKPFLFFKLWAKEVVWGLLDPIWEIYEFESYTSAKRYADGVNQKGARVIKFTQDYWKEVKR
jgi:hypothetical protein